MDTIVHVRGTSQQIRDAIFKVGKAAAGQGGTQEARNGLLIRLGVTLLGRIHAAFIIKANGGTDDCGLKWPPLAPSTIAYGRRHPGLKYPGEKRAPLAPSAMLTAQQRKRWWSIYRAFGGKRAKGRAYHAGKDVSAFFGINQQDSGWAAARAWNILKEEGAQTIIGTYGHATGDVDGPIQILRDTGLLLNSLSPGLTSRGNAAKVKDQVFNIGQSDVIVGTNRPHARTHHEGKGRIPQRRLWPAPRNWNPVWWDALAKAAQEGLKDIILAILRRRTV